MTKTRTLLFTSALVCALTGCGSDGFRQGDLREYTPALTQYSSCNALEADLKASLIAEAHTHIDQLDQPGGWWGPPEAGAEDSADAGGSREEGVDYSGTNNQEDGVDEADFVKTDGYYIYTLNGNRLHIFGVPTFGDLVPESETQIEGIPRQMVIDKDNERAVVFSMIYPWNLPEEHPLYQLMVETDDSGNVYWHTSTLTKLTIFDISDRSAPALERELFFEGHYQTARFVDGTVRAGVYSYFNVPGVFDYWNYWAQASEDKVLAKALIAARINALSLEDLVPTTYERLPSGVVSEHTLTNGSCRGYYKPAASHGRGFTSLATIDLSDSSLSLDADHVVSNRSVIYASKDRMVIAEPSHDWWWFWSNSDHDDTTNIHVFDTRSDGATGYIGSGRVDGVLINQFALDEHNGTIRAATTTNMWARWWVENPPEAENNIFVLAKTGPAFTTVGHVGGIAPGERIFAARFEDDRAFLVTFQQTDPLFTFDLSIPSNPTQIGELEIPGFSTYIHPIADDRLLTVGVGGDENGANWKAQVSMFDVSNFAAPTLTDVEPLVLGDNWGWSESLYEHKAFQYWAPKGLLALPLGSHRYVNGHYEYTSTLELIGVDTTTGLSRNGSIDHGSFYNADPERYWYYQGIRRSIFMGDFVYAISDAGITAHDLDTLTEQASSPLPGYDPEDWYWWW